MKVRYSLIAAFAVMSAPVFAQDAPAPSTQESSPPAQTEPMAPATPPAAEAPKATDPAPSTTPGSRSPTATCGRGAPSPTLRQYRSAASAADGSRRSPPDQRGPFATTSRPTIFINRRAFEL